MDNQMTINLDLLSKSNKFKLHSGSDLLSKSILENESLFIDNLPHEIVGIEVSYFNKTIYGIGIKNNRGGYELYAPEFINRPVSLIKSGCTLIRHKKGQESAYCCLFFSLFDYLSYYTLSKKYIMPLPSAADCIIVGNIKNFIQAMLDTESYEITYCILPNTIVGKTMSRTIHDRNPSNSIDISYIYKEYDSIHDYIKHQTNNIL